MPRIHPPPPRWYISPLVAATIRGAGVVTFSRGMRDSSVWQEVKSIPLPAYFITIGALLTAPLLLVNFVFEPSKPESSAHAATGFMQNTVGTAPTARAAGSQYASSERTGSSAQPAYQQSGTDEAARKSAKKAQPRSGQGVIGHANRDSRYSSYAQTAPNWRSPAEGTLGPH